jgi:futalosine hydrolase
MVSTTYFLTREIEQHHPDLIIQAGIAGCFQKDRNSSIVAISIDNIGDMGACENGTFRNIFDLKLVEKNEYPFVNASLINPHQKLISLSDCKPVNAITVNEVTTDQTRVEYYQQNYNPFVESMEGAAFHYVCLHEKIPFIQIRSISNFIGERDKSKWKIDESITSLNAQLILLINKLSDYNETHSWI